MRHRGKAAVCIAALFLLSGCATRGWVRDAMSQERATQNERYTRLEGVVTQHGDRLDATTERLAQVDRRLTQLSDGRYERRTVQTVDLRFGFDRAELDDAAQTALIGLVKDMKADRRLAVDVVGYADSRGSREYNLTLSQRRAEAVRRYLVQHGIELSRIHAIGFGTLEAPTKGSAPRRAAAVRLTIPVDIDIASADTASGTRTANAADQERVSSP